MKTGIKLENIPLLKIEAEDYTEGYSEDGINQTGYYAEVNDGPIDISISYNDGETIRYRAILTNGDWARYTFDLEAGGAYRFVLNGIGAGEFYLDKIKNPIPFKCADDGKAVIATIMLDAGEHTVKIVAPRYLDADYISLYAGGGDFMTAEDVAAYVPPAEVAVDTNAVQMEIYVSPDGSDTNAGTKDAPFVTMSRAKEEVRKYNTDMFGNIIVHFAPGYYQLDECVVFSEEDGGTNGYSIIYQGDSETKSAVLSGGTRIEGWERTSLLDGKIWKASANIPDTRNLYINGYPAQRAISSYQYMYTENLEPTQERNNDPGNKAEQPAEVRSYGVKAPKQDIFLALKHPEDVELVWPEQFVHQRTPVMDIYEDPENPDMVVFEMDMPYWEWANTKDAYFTNPVNWDKYPDVVNLEMTFYLENDLALLDEPGEFYFDRTAKEMYYYPYEQEDLTTAEVYAGTTEFMVQVMGTSATSRVENITFKNLGFRYGAWKEPNTTGVQITQTDQLVGHRRTIVGVGGKTMPGQITLNFTRNVNIYDCEFRCLGSSALVMDNGVADTEVIGNRFIDIAGTGIMIDSYLNRGILPADRVRCDNILVANNVIRRPANQYYGMVGVSMYMPSNTIVRNNDIKGTPYSGMAAGWGWRHAAAVASANDKIINNKIEDVMKILKDGGHIYTLDRVHNLEIAGNYLLTSGDYRGGIYLDTGSRSYNIHNNVAADTEKWFFGRVRAHIEDIKLYNNYYDAASTSEIDPYNITAINNIPVERSADGTPDWPGEALDIIARAGLEDDYKRLLDGTDLPQWRKDLLDMMPRELIRANIKRAFDEEGVITIWAQSHIDHMNTEAYIRNAGEAVKYYGAGNGYTTWSLAVENDNTYMFTVIGNGMVLTDLGFTGITGKLYVDDKLRHEMVLNTSERLNPWESPLESVFGVGPLEAGTHTVKFQVEGGTYVMDRMTIVLSTAES